MRRDNAPATRIVYAGDAPPGAEFSARVALEALEAQREALRPGRVLADVYAAWQRVVDRALGPGRVRRHRCGYLVGTGFPIGWFNGSRIIGISPDSAVVVRKNMVFNAFSWISAENLPAHVVSDTVLVGQDSTTYLTTPMPSSKCGTDVR